MNRTAAVNTLKIVAFALAASLFFNFMLFNFPKVLIGMAMVAMMIAGAKMIYDFERDRLESLKRLNEIR